MDVSTTWQKKFGNSTSEKTAIKRVKEDVGNAATTAKIKNVSAVINISKLEPESFNIP